jgi:hypothetical protein
MEWDPLDDVRMTISAPVVARRVRPGQMRVAENVRREIPDVSGRLGAMPDEQRPDPREPAPADDRAGDAPSSIIRPLEGEWMPLWCPIERTRCRDAGDGWRQGDQEDPLADDRSDWMIRSPIKGYQRA